ncbi:MAG: peptidoglycan DD-metalloendopeptidase family protein [Actinobacteria bacterium]|nr:peptidoglycan DD-metalloendopeptidase family protein [Actinomycetota bacterium]
MRRILVAAVALATLVAVPAARAWTWPIDGPILRSFSFGSDPYAGGQHRGIDIGAAIGTPVHAPVSGTVSFVGSLPNGGRAVTIQTSDGYAVTLLQLGSVEALRGSAVDEGATVGAVGESADATTTQSHVHLGVRLASDSDGYVDPLGFLPARAGVSVPTPIPVVPASVIAAPVVPAPVVPALVVSGPVVSVPAIVHVPTPAPAVDRPPPTAPVAASVSPPTAQPAVTEPEPQPVPEPTPTPALPLAVESQVAAPAPAPAVAEPRVDPEPVERSTGDAPVMPVPAAEQAAPAPAETSFERVAIEPRLRDGERALRAIPSAPAPIRSVRARLVLPQVNPRSLSRISVLGAGSPVAPLTKTERASEARARRPKALRPKSSATLSPIPVTGEHRKANRPVAPMRTVEVDERDSRPLALVLGLTLVGWTAAILVRRRRPPIISGDELLPDDPDLLRERQAAHRPCVHDDGSRHPRAPSPTAGRGDVLPDRSRRACGQGRAGRRRAGTRPQGVRRSHRRRVAGAAAAAERVDRLLHTDER